MTLCTALDKTGVDHIGYDGASTADNVGAGKDWPWLLGGPSKPVECPAWWSLCLPGVLGLRQTVYANSVTLGEGFGPRPILIPGEAGDKGEPCELTLVYVTEPK